MENRDIISNILTELEYIDTSELNHKQQMMVARVESLLDDLAWELQEEEAVEFMKQINEEEK
ncbi:ATP synthase subunit alpha [Staphylococcus phage vB_SsapH-Golestan-100]|nr:ATP synthase subunit alpha [Staphylococcus phage vB_SsapH-Golestan-100]